MVNLLSRLPLCILYRVADIFYVLLYYVGIYRKPIVFDNLRKAFPEKSETEIRTLAKGCFRYLADLSVEIFKARTMSQAQLMKRMKFTNIEVIEPYIQQKQNMMFLTMHHGNWEWLLLSSCLQMPFPTDAVYKPQHRWIDNFLLKTRSRFGAKPLPTNEAMKTLMKQRHEWRSFALVADLTPRAQHEKYWAKAFNLDTAFHSGPETLAKITKYPVIFVGMRRVKRGYYEVTLEPIAAPPYDKNTLQIMPKYVEKFTEWVLKDPQIWTWNYKRWAEGKPVYS